MKRIHFSFRAWLVSLTALLAALPACADVTLNQLEFTEVKGGYSVKKKWGETLEGALVIPDTYGGKPVVEIGEYAFSACYGLTSVHIPDGVTTIGSSAFEGCWVLTQIEVSEANTAYCSIDGVLYNKAKDAILCCPGGRQGEFSIPETVTTIGDYAFEGCWALTSITIPDGVTTIGKGAFSGCSGLTQIEVSEANTAYCSIDRVLYNKAKDTILCCPGGRQGEFSIPETVTTIGSYAFYNCSGLKSVTIPDAVTTIGNRAFDSCSGLTSITIPDAVTTIGGAAFRGCSGLTSINIPDAITTIGDEAFYFCSGLTSVHIGDAVTTIGYWAFSSCSGLMQIEVSEANTAYCSIDGVLYNKAKDTILCCPAGRQGEFSIPETVTTIGSYVFYSCSGLTSITIPDAVTTIGEGAFYSCSGLTSINIPDAVTTIGNYVFAYCSGLTSITIPDAVTTIGDYAFYRCSDLTSVHIGDGVTSIGDWAFFDCLGLTGINIPDAVTTIGDHAFASCYGLTSITIPDAVTTIGEGAFGGCFGLTSVHIGNGVTTIGDRAFRLCDVLTEITCSATTPPSIYYWSFDDSHYAEAIVYVPQEAVETYRQDEKWGRFQNIVGKNLTSIGRIGAESTDDAASATAVYDLRGAKIAASPEGLPQGTYIVRQGGKSKKISVK